MSDSSSKVRNVQDTARWVAYFRARETERSDALFRDPYAKQLAGERGLLIAHALPEGNKHAWAWVARTYLFDQLLEREISEGAGLVINLAAGLDARPYRMELPRALEWVEVDLPEILSYKEEILAGQEPRCRLERFRLDLADAAGRRALFTQLGQRADKIVVMCEGLLIYLAAEEVASLAEDLAAVSTFRTWLVDLASPGQLRLMQRGMGKELSAAGAAFKFGPAEGSNFFVPHGWAPAAVHGLMKTAARLNRLPKELHSLLPEPEGLPGNYPWTGVCLLKRSLLPAPARRDRSSSPL